MHLHITSYTHNKHINISERPSLNGFSLIPYIFFLDILTNLAVCLK